VNKNGKPGEILSRDLTVACGTSALALKTVQPQDRKAMDGTSFMNGGGINVGDVLT
jgi:methionyl-tRNA formyltransferase